MRKSRIRLLRGVLPLAVVAMVASSADGAAQASAAAVVVVTVGPRLAVEPRPPIVVVPSGRENTLSATFAVTLDADAQNVSLHVVPSPMCAAAGGLPLDRVAAAASEDLPLRRRPRNVAVRVTWEGATLDVAAARYAGKVKLVAVLMP